MTPTEWWDREATRDERYATLAWGGDGTPEIVAPTMGAIMQNLRVVIDSVRADRRLTIMEIGCGPGRLLRPLAEEMFDDNFYGVDVSHEMVALAGPWPENVITYSPLKSPRDMPDDVGLLDVIYSVEVFQHLTNDEMMEWFHYARRALAPGGRFVFQYVVGDEPGGEMWYQRSSAALHERLWLAGLVNQAVGLNRVHDEWRWVIAS